MMGSTRTKTVLLVALLVAWGAILGVRHFTTPPPPPVRTSGTESVRTPVAQGGGLPRLKAELLNVPRPPVPTQVQNIFGNVQPPPLTEVARAPVSPVPAPPPPPDPFLEEAKRLRYLGYIEYEAKRKALILQGQDIHMLEAGEAFGGLFRVKSVTDEYVLLVSPDGSKETRLESKQESAPSGPAPMPAPGMPRPAPPFPRM